MNTNFEYSQMSVNKPGITGKLWECKSAHGTVRGTSSYGASSNLQHREIKSHKWCPCSVAVQRTCALLPSPLTCIHLATSLDTYITYYQVIKKHSAWNSVYNQCNRIRGFKEENRTWEQSQNAIQHPQKSVNLNYVISWFATALNIHPIVCVITGP
jgi:hypothetical protein